MIHSHRHQIDQLTERRLRLTELEPMFQDLSLNRDVLQANVRDFTVRAQQSRAAQEIAAGGGDNIRIVQRASPRPRAAPCASPSRPWRSSSPPSRPCAWGC